MKKYENHAFSKKIEPSQLNCFVKNVDSSTFIWTVTLVSCFFSWSKLCWWAFELALGKLVQLKNIIFFPICFVFAKSESLEQEREKVVKEHSVLEQI